MDMEGESKERHNRGDLLMSNLNRRFQPPTSTVKKRITVLLDKYTPYDVC